MKSSSSLGAGQGYGAILARDLVVGYGRGSRSLGLRGLSAELRPGITGLVGPNGAGKTTLLRTLAGGLKPLSGRLEIFGRDPDTQRRLGGTGFLPEHPPLPHHMTVQEFLAGLSRGQKGGEPAASPSPAPLFPEELSTRLMGSLSLGQKKRVALTAALAGDPHLLLLDEPTNGLDPMAVRWLRDVLQNLKGIGKVILVSSHHLDELQRMADVLIFVRDGVATGSWSRDEALQDFPSLEALFESEAQGVGS